MSGVSTIHRTFWNSAGAESKSSPSMSIVYVLLERLGHMDEVDLANGGCHHGLIA
jgi:hypothetical protein